MPVYLITMLILLTGTGAQARICRDLFAPDRAVPRVAARVNSVQASLVRDGKFQEAAWELRRQGRRDEARALETRLENILLNDPIVSVRPLHEALSERGIENTGSTEALFFVTLRSGITAVAKHRSGDYENPNGPRSEVAASEVSRIFELDTVPLTVKRRVSGKQMSLQYFVRDLPDGSVRDHVYRPESWLTDFLIAYADLISSRQRNKPDNYLLDSADRQILIDNSSAFNTAWQPPAAALKQEWGTLLHALRQSNLTLSQIAPSRAVLERLRVPEAEIRNRLNGKLPRQEIDNLIMRRDYYVQRMRRFVSGG